MDQDVIPMDMDLPRYEMLDTHGMLDIITGRVDGELVAYWTGFVMGHFHYASTTHCFTDLYYVHPPWRKGWTALRMFHAAHALLRAQDVVKVASGTKLLPGLDMSRLFEFMGYRRTEALYTKLL